MSAAQILQTESGHRSHELAAAELLPIMSDLYALARIKFGNLDPYANAVFMKADMAFDKYKADMLKVREAQA